jgi:hypothetical protein
VFNLEVDADHCYRVGEQGILVHNASCKSTFSNGLQPLESVTFEGKVRMRATGVKDAVITPAMVASRVGGANTHDFNRSGPGWWADFKAKNPVTPPDEWQRGHLLGTQLGGEGGSNWPNMAPMHLLVNKSVMVMCENRIAEYIKNCDDCVTYSATPVYSGNNLHPNYVLIVAVSRNLKSDNKTPVFRLRVRVYNEANPPPRQRCESTGKPPPCC